MKRFKHLAMFIAIFGVAWSVATVAAMLLIGYMLSEEGIS